MGFIVVYQGAGEISLCAEHPTLHDAAQFVEQLCNTHGIRGARILQAEEVHFDVRPYYRVELGTSPQMAGEPERVVRRSGVPADWVTFADRLDAIEAVESAVGAAAGTDAGVPAAGPPAPVLVTAPSPVRTVDDSGVLRRGLFGR